jgi:arabinofuranan 3-O-arabinosyltransferase
VSERRVPRTWRPGVWVLALLTYLPALTAAPGRMPTDTKLYLYLNPGRLIADAPFSWDTRQFAGWVPHQTIAYLWPSGPWFWVFDRLGVPDWIAHRLWLGTLLFLGGLGVRWAAHHLGLASTAATVAGVVYAVSPYILPYVSRTSVMLLPWAGVGWIVGLTIRATYRTRWRDAALAALVVLTVGAVNATALALVAPAPILWLLHAAWARTITWRTAVVTALKIGVLSVLVSLWWMVMLVVQGRHGADVLAFSETLRAVSLTSTSTEVLRNLGYWLFYVRDPYAFTTTASIHYLTSVQGIVVSYAVIALALGGLALTRWANRRYAALLVATGVVLAVGVHPIDHPSPLMAPLAESGLGLALRSSTRAVPLSSFGLALGAGALVAALGGVRRRWQPWAACAMGLLAVVNVPALWHGGLVDPALERDQDVPAAWREAAAALDAGPSEMRVLQVPGSEFGAFRWGYTVDPPLPGLTDKPLVTRDLLPLGSPGAMDLLYALDNRFQAGTIEPDAIARVARLLGVDTIWVPNDLAFDRFRTPRPEVVSDLFAQQPDGLAAPVGYGSPTPNTPDVAMIDEEQLSDSRIGTPLAPVELVGVDDAQAIVRALTRTVVLAGSGDGVVDAAAAGLLAGDEAVVYAADLASSGTDAYHVADDAPLIVTDANRDRAEQWRGSQDVLGFTETGGDAPGVSVENTADQRLAVFPTVDADQQTVAVLDGGLEVTASDYGEPFAYRPEDRAAMAVDGDPTTAWRVADRSDPVGQRIEVSTTDGRLALLQQQRPEATRRIAQVRITVGDEEPRLVDLDDSSLTAPGQTVEVASGTHVSIEITAVAAVPGGTDSGPSAVGFAELGPVAVEWIRPPAAPLADLGTDRPLALVLTRDRVDATDRWRSDPEPVLRRVFTLPSERSFDATVTLRLDARAPDGVLDAIAGTGGATADRRLTGVPAARGSSAVDGDLSTAWTTPFGQAVGATLTVTLADGASVDHFDLVQPTDGLHATITKLSYRSAAGEAVIDVAPPDADGRSSVVLPTAATGELVLTIDAVADATTIDRRYAERVRLPASIVELDGVPVAAPAPAAPTGCRTDLLTVDGRAIGVVVDDLAALAAGGTVQAALCDGPLALGSGEHRLSSTSTIGTGIEVDRVTLRDGVDVVAAPAAHPSVDVERTRTTRDVTVSACPDGCWLVLGEGYDDAWTARLGGDDLGAPLQIAGGFNGWWLPPSTETRTATMTWSPQSGLDLALLIAVLGVVVCVAVAVLDRRRLTPAPDTPAPVFDDRTEPVSRRTAALAAGVLVVSAAAVVSPSWGALALLPAVALVLLRRPRTASVAAAVLTAVLGAVVAWRQLADRHLPDAAWPGWFEDLHRAGMFVVALLLAGSLDADSEPGSAPDVPLVQESTSDSTAGTR